MANFADMEREQQHRMLTDQRISAPLPSVGRTVIYNAYGTPKGEYKPEPRAAVITQVHTPDDPYSDVGLCVLNPTGMFFNVQIKYGVNEPGCWNWPTSIGRKYLHVAGDYQLKPGEDFPDRAVPDRF